MVRIVSKAETKVMVRVRVWVKGWRCEKLTTLGREGRVKGNMHQPMAIWGRGNGMVVAAHSVGSLDLVRIMVRWMWWGWLPMMFQNYSFSPSSTVASAASWLSTAMYRQSY